MKITFVKVTPLEVGFLGNILKAFVEDCEEVCSHLRKCGNLWYTYHGEYVWHSIDVTHIKKLDIDGKHAFISFDRIKRLYSVTCDIGDTQRSFECSDFNDILFAMDYERTKNFGRTGAN